MYLFFCRALLVHLVPEVLRVLVVLTYVWPINSYTENDKTCIRKWKRLLDSDIKFAFSLVSCITMARYHQFSFCIGIDNDSCQSLFPVSGSTRPSRRCGPHGIRRREGKSHQILQGVLSASDFLQENIAGPPLQTTRLPPGVAACRLVISCSQKWCLSYCLDTINAYFTTLSNRFFSTLLKFARWLHAKYLIN